MPLIGIVGQAGAGAWARSWRLPQRWIRADQQSSSDRGSQQHDRDRGGAGFVAGLDLLADEDRGDLRFGRPPAKSRTEPYSPSARAKARATPAARPGRRLGKMMRRKIVKPPAPSEAAASSISRSISISSGCTARTTKGRVTKQQGDDDRGAGQRDVDPDRAVLAPELDQDQAGDDRRQREGQVDDRVDDRLAGEVVTDQEPGDDRAEDGVDQRRRSASRPGSAPASRPPAAG